MDGGNAVGQMMEEDDYDLCILKLRVPRMICAITVYICMHLRLLNHPPNFA